MLFEDQLAASKPIQQEGRHPGRRDRLRAAGRRPRRRARAGHHHRRGLPLLLTDKRKFIVADTPGHEQYTRNMVTGASTADVAVILIDARKGVLTQTRRHSYLVSLLGIRQVVLAVNKMDLVDYSRRSSTRIDDEYRAFARRSASPTSRPSRCRR
jgi:bifunctional enzyme CysN/CysC